MDYLLEEWKGPREIEVRDVGPYRCLITFSTTEIRDEAVNNQLLQLVFDELRFHWDFFWSLLRRVWLEITGMPIGLWSTENFNKIAELWGKVINYDDRTQESKSFSMARLMIDSFQWHMIHEWVNVTIDDHRFEVFVKEVGHENYSVESHPNRDEGKLEGIEGSDDEHVRMVTPAIMENIPATSLPTNLKIVDVEDPLIEAIINSTFIDEYDTAIGKEENLGRGV
ncbi:hypothetical protein PIB30_008303 [Stylosanthes scabra]|uniref:DUF4283 domain-containing protein n=1 Tax=Stylosanthes scabra TaxID=79078 RepID=A0ABU6S587_9FABA|nr:hypothetical protein [Stylosanthes scabra]